jgi:hypothetical protein
MKYEFDLNLSRGYICIRTYGEASVRGFEKLMTEIADLPNWKPETNLLIDHRKLNSSNFSSDEMDEVKDLVTEKKEIIGNGRCAFVVSNKLGYGIARMYGLLGGEFIHAEIDVFYSEDEAIAWLVRSASKDSPGSDDCPGTN